MTLCLLPGVLNSPVLSACVSCTRLECTLSIAPRQARAASIAASSEGCLMRYVSHRGALCWWAKKQPSIGRDRRLVPEALRFSSRSAGPSFCSPAWFFVHGRKPDRDRTWTVAGIGGASMTAAVAPTTKIVTADGRMLPGIGHQTAASARSGTAATGPGVHAPAPTKAAATVERRGHRRRRSRKPRTTSTRR